MQSQGFHPAGLWKPHDIPPAFSMPDIGAVMPRVREPVHVVYDPAENRLGLGRRGEVLPYAENVAGAFPLLSSLPALYPEWLGDRSFLEEHRVRFPYIAGEMYRGIASAEMVVAMARAGMLGFLGAAGMGLDELEKNIDRIRNALDGGDLSWGSNLIYMPDDPDLENAVVDLYLRKGVRRVCAAAFVAITPAVVRYSATGLRADRAGRIRRTNHLFAKISRPETARRFMEPAPKIILDRLVSRGLITAAEASLALRAPLAGDITVEADSGGHTDNRPLPVVFPAVMNLRNRLMPSSGQEWSVRIGAAGGLGTPEAVAGAFSMGAAYVLTGSVNQSAVEAGISPEAKEMLAAAGVGDFAMAPAADMFEMGARVQVLKKGTLFSGRAAHLHRLYSEYKSIEGLPGPEREKIEREIFRAPLEDIWEHARRFFLERRPDEIARAEREPGHRMALVFRWYLGNAAAWAIGGERERRLDYQICSGPAMAAFNGWVKGSFMEDPARRSVVQIALNLLEGAAVVTRAQLLRSCGLPVPASSFDFRPRPLR